MGVLYITLIQQIIFWTILWGYERCQILVIVLKLNQQMPSIELNFLFLDPKLIMPLFVCCEVEENPKKVLLLSTHLSTLWHKSQFLPICPRILPFFQKDQKVYYEPARDKSSTRDCQVLSTFNTSWSASQSLAATPYIKHRYTVRTICISWSLATCQWFGDSIAVPLFSNPNLN